jgi:hypothetical protein
LRSEIVLTLAVLLLFLVPISTLREEEPLPPSRSSGREEAGLIKLLARLLAATAPSFYPLGLVPPEDPLNPGVIGVAVGVLLPEAPWSVIRRLGTDLRLLVLDRFCLPKMGGEAEPELAQAS